MKKLIEKFTSTDEVALDEQSTVSNVNDTLSSIIDVSDDTLVSTTETKTEDVEPIANVNEVQYLFPGGPIIPPYNENFVYDSQNHLRGLSLLVGRATIYLHLLERYDEKYNYSKKYIEGFLNVTEVSEFLQLSKSSIYRLIKTKKLKASKMHREWYFKMTHVDEYIRKYVLW